MFMINRLLRLFKSEKFKILFLLKYSVSIGLIVLIVSRADLNSFLTMVKEVNVFPYGMAFLVAAFSMLVRSYKWQLLLKAQGINVPLLKVQNLNYMSMFFSNLFLGSIGGDMFRIYRVMGYSNSMGAVAFSVMMERMTGLCMAFFLVLVFGSGFVLISTSLVKVDLLLTLLLLGIITGLVLFVIFKISPKLMNLTILRKTPMFAMVSKELLDSMNVYKNQSKIVILTLALSLLYHIGNSVTVYYFVVAANGGVSLIPLFFIAPLVGILVVIPISINGIGIQEGAYIFYLEQIGVAPSTALFVAVLSRVLLLVFSLIGGLLVLIHRDSSQRKTVSCIK